MSKASNEIFIGKKPLMTYVTATLVQLASEDKVFVKARGNSIVRAVDVAQIIEKRMDSMGYKVGGTKIGTEQLQSLDGKNRNVSTIEIEISKGQGSSVPSSEKKVASNQGKKGKKKD
ncbi:MAG: DNA-binding protein [Thaumarchaeota archaeon]|nr:DNA-binding protein [Nitrososphaerota archaeon]